MKVRPAQLVPKLSSSGSFYRLSEANRSKKQRKERELNIQTLDVTEDFKVHRHQIASG